MKEKIYKTEDILKIELEIPLKSRRCNPWNEDFQPEMDNIVGVIAGDEIGFANWIDMDYKDKADQVSTLFYLYQGEPEDFKKLCSTLQIDIVEYPLCIKCNKVVYGAYRWDGGPICFDCEKVR